MHCKSCKILIRDILEDEGIEIITVSLEEGILEINTNNKKKSKGIIQEISFFIYTC